LDDDNRFDFHLTASWLHEIESSFVKRESQAPPAGETELIKDLKYRRGRDVLNLRADFGLLWDLGLHVNAPLVLAESNTLDFDQSAGGSCVFVEEAMTTGVRPTCVNQNNATILQDGILPGFQGSAWGLDARNGDPFTMRPSDESRQTGVFRSPRRRGFEYLGVGITWAAMNQARDDTKPTWTLTFDANLDVFKDRRFDPANPGANTAVGPGYHQFVWSTFISKRFRHFDPYVGAWYMLPARTNGSPFQRFGSTQTEVNPQQRAGLVIGVEQVAWENVAARQRFTVEARFHVEQRFFGRAHSELWEPLSGRSTCNSNLAGSECRSGIDLDLDGDGQPDRAHPGVTAVEAYARFGGDLGLNVHVGRYIRFRGLFGLATNMPHFITAAGAGVDTNRDGRVLSNDVSEANPTYREAIDLPGRRFRVEGTTIYTLFLQGSLMF
jgi:hypothetical protein